MEAFQLLVKRRVPGLRLSRRPEDTFGGDSKGCFLSQPDIPELSRREGFWPGHTSFDSNSSLVLCFLGAAMSVSIASIGFRSTMVRRSLRMASMCLAGK